MRAVISVSDKAGVVDLARDLGKLGWEIFTTGGTMKTLQDAGLKVSSISEVTGFPEILDGRVKTLHPKIYGGILARRELPAHMGQLKEHRIATVDMVVVNLYPFLATVTRPGTSLEEAIENIDIGGPSMIRAAAKNYADVLVVVDPADYAWIVEKLKAGGLDAASRKKLAAKAYQHTASYDTMVAQYLREPGFPEEMTVALRKRQALSYGENPHQEAAFYVEQTIKKTTGMGSLAQHSGKDLSFNNLLDLDACLRLLADFSEPTVAIIKHNNACGLASRDDLAEAYRLALAGDPVAAFGGVVAVNRIIDLPAAREIAESHYDAIVAPGFSAEALSLLKQKKDLRLVSVPDPISVLDWDYRRVAGGFLVQSPDRLGDAEFKPKVVTKRSPGKSEWEDLFFAWKAARHLKSNAIAIARDKTLLGMGAGQPSRVMSVKIALEKAGGKARGGVLASDAFFPFLDNVEVAAAGGVTAVIEPGGSVRDKECIDAADRFGMAMVFTGVRHFRH
ncbi:MAG: bifunctional phosphoribosylaminoimidazolecarboxamide formyltransferase/IMP cyclohydrolase [Chloroflexota bacterium]